MNSRGGCGNRGGRGSRGGSSSSSSVGGAVLTGILNACMKLSLRLVNDNDVSPCLLTLANELSDRATQ
jgi:hypothetical protein